MLESINLGQRLALTDDQQIIPITNMLDSFGDETDNPAEAVAIVAGPTAEGKWISDDVSTFEFTPNQVN